MGSSPDMEKPERRLKKTRGVGSYWSKNYLPNTLAYFLARQAEFDLLSPTPLRGTPRGRRAAFFRKMKSHPQTPFKQTTPVVRPAPITTTLPQTSRLVQPVPNKATQSQTSPLVQQAPRTATLPQTSPFVQPTFSTAPDPSSLMFLPGMTPQIVQPPPFWCPVHVTMGSGTYGRRPLFQHCLCGGFIRVAKPMPGSHPGQIRTTEMKPAPQERPKSAPAATHMPWPNRNGFEFPNAFAKEHGPSGHQEQHGRDLGR
ncbi:hypothetical protein GGS21DRAFT_519318 [Xylaria nigripes]|nr:hypothetical protein GGS21DRAFT_519318 [Xylaria nigripes]